MYLDLLSPSNQIICNRAIAKQFGLSAAVYIAELMSLYKKAVDEKKVTVSKISGKTYFDIDRGDIANRTTINKTEQKKIDDNLKLANIISYKKGVGDTSICLDVDFLAAMLCGEIPKSILEEIRQLPKLKAEAIHKSENSKKQSEVDSFMKSITTSNHQLREAYRKWIEACLDKYGFIRDEAIKAAEAELNDFAGSNEQAALWVLNYTTQHSYVSMEWGIKEYTKSSSSYAKSPQSASNYIVQQTPPSMMRTRKLTKWESGRGVNSEDK